jgi:hypothetical protein
MRYSKKLEYSRYYEAQMHPRKARLEEVDAELPLSLIVMPLVDLTYSLQIY